MKYEYLDDVINELYGISNGQVQLGEDGISVLLMDLREHLIRRIEDE